MAEKYVHRRTEQVPNGRQRRYGWGRNDRGHMNEVFAFVGVIDCRGQKEVTHSNKIAFR